MTSAENTSNNQAAKGNISLVVDSVTVKYKTTNSDPTRHDSLSFLQRARMKLLGRDPEVSVTAVNDVSFVSYEGDSIGFLGVNGAGKSSLLRVVAGVEAPHAGQVYAMNQPALLGVSAVLMPELSGYENARLGCLAMGLTPEETVAALPGVVEFTGLGPAIHHPMKSYSSGMGARLRFAISTAARPEILIIDEALSTGDATFQAKSQERMDELLSGSGTVLLVSHSANQVSDLCNRAIWMHRGEVISDGDVEVVADQYREWAKYLRADSEKANAYMQEVRGDYVKPFASVRLV